MPRVWRLLAVGGGGIAFRRLVQLLAGHEKGGIDLVQTILVATEIHMTPHDAMIAQIIRCARYQNEKIPVPDGIPHASEGVCGMGDCLPEEPMGNEQPTVPCEVETVSEISTRPPITTTYDGSWA